MVFPHLINENYQKKGKAATNWLEVVFTLITVKMQFLRWLHSEFWNISKQHHSFSRLHWNQTIKFHHMKNNLPNNLLIKGLVLKGSKSSMCSPVPIKIMGLLVAATLRRKWDMYLLLYWNPLVDVTHEDDNSVNNVSSNEYHSMYF